MDVGTERLILQRSVEAQGYQRVAVEYLNEIGAINLNESSVPLDLGNALKQTGGAPDWLAIGHRFALLKDMADGHFDSLFIRTEERRLHLVVVTRFGTSPMEAPWFDTAFDYAWPIVAGLEQLLPSFALPPTVQSVANNLIAAYLHTSDPLVAAAASLLNAAVALDWVGSGPAAAFVAIAEAGCTPDLASRLDHGYWQKKEELKLNPPYLAGFLWDVGTGNVHGKDQLGGGTLNSGELGASVRGQ